MNAEDFFVASRGKGTAVAKAMARQDMVFFYKTQLLKPKRKAVFLHGRRKAGTTTMGIHTLDFWLKMPYGEDVVDIQSMEEW